MLLVLAALPGLFWEGGPDTAPALRDAGITQIVVPAAKTSSWQSVSGISVTGGDVQKAVKLPVPTVNYRMDLGSASRSPWLVTNGWQFVRHPGATFYYDVPGAQAAVAAAEAFCYGGTAWIKTDEAGLKPFAKMLAFLRGIQAEDMPPVADIGFTDDGTGAAGEVINLMIRDNLLFRVVKAPDPSLKLNVRLGTKEYPVEEAKNPGGVAHTIRTNLTDEKRSLRIYGTTVVVGRLTGTGGRVRLQLINYAGAARKVSGMRVRVMGEFPKHHAVADDSTGVELMDYTVESGATEFTLPELKTFAVVDLSR